MKHRIFVVILMVACLGTVSVFAEWVPTPIIFVTDPELRQELVDCALSELYVNFPLLTEEQKVNFSTSVVYELYPWPDRWCVTLYYDGCITTGIDVKLVRKTSGELERISTFERDVYGLLEAYHSGISMEDAIAIGRINFARVITEEYERKPDKAKSFIDTYGIAALDPASFLVEAQFHCRYNGGLKDEAPRWHILFVYPNKAEEGTDSDENPIWYVIKMDAATGVIISEFRYAFFKATD